MPTVRTRQLIVAAVLAIFVYGVIAAMLGTIMPTFQLTPDQNANVALAQAVGLILASVSVGPLIDSRGKKTALIIGLGLLTVALFALPRASGYGQIMAYFFLLGLGGGVLVTAANALASDINEAQRSSTLNLLNLFFGLGGLATPFIAANLLSGDAVRLCYLAVVLVALTFAFHIFTPMPAPTGGAGFQMAEMNTVLKRPALYMIAFFLFLYVGCEVGVWNWLVAFLVSKQIPKDRALNILSLGFALGILVGRVVVSRILIRVPAITVTLGSAVLMAVTTFLMLNTTDLTMTGVAVFCAGLAMAPVFPTTLGMVGDAFPRMTATAMGIVITCGWIGLAVSSRLIGYIAGSDSSNLKNALLIIPGASVLMILVNLALRPMLYGHAGNPVPMTKAG